MTAPSGAGRFAPSPSADLHIGNLRTAVLAWLFARSTGRRFLLRVEDLDDRTFDDVAARQLADLAALGLTWDDQPEYQTAHTARYDAVIDELTDRGLAYECYCSRRDILQAPRAPHAPEGAYPGTCRELTEDRAAARRAPAARPALRLRSDTGEYTVTDLLHGSYTGVVDDLVLRRGDGVAGLQPRRGRRRRARRASTRWCAATTCCPPRHGRPTSARCWAIRRRSTPTCRWYSMPTGSGWPSATAR